MAEHKAEIVERISKGEPLAAICRDLNLGRRTVYDWQEADPEFAAHIARARMDGFDAIADECMAIADQDSEDVPRDKLRIDTRLKLLAKWDPKRYGELIKHAGADGEGPVQSAVTVSFVKTDGPGTG